MKSRIVYYGGLEIICMVKLVLLYILELKLY